MKIHLSLILLASGLALGGFVSAGPAPASDGLVLSGFAARSAETIATGWKARAADNICGISDLRKVSNPAVVDYAALLRVTPQMKRMKKEKIDPDSARGKLLRNDAATLVNRKCAIVCAQRGFCGIWKAIRHEDGRRVPNVTADVRSEIQNEE